jgi:hypothetical protein
MEARQMGIRIGRTMIAPLATLMAVFLVTAPGAAGVDSYMGQPQQGVQEAADRARRSVHAVLTATDQYHDVARAIADGFTPLPSEAGAVGTCVGDADGGSGIRYVRELDSGVIPSQPEAMVYELNPDGPPRLLAVEYIVPAMFIEDELGRVVALPEVFGQPLRRHATLPIYALRAWVWKENPLGMFAEVNPSVGDCSPA